jgi:hypothetical protein
MREIATNKKILALRVDGASVEEIAQNTGASIEEVVDTIAAAGYSLKNLQGIATEAKIKGLGASRLQRLTALSIMRDKVQAEIESRDLSEIPTDKLITLFMKLQESIKEEVVIPTIYPTEIKSVADIYTSGKDGAELNISIDC